MSVKFGLAQNVTSDPGTIHTINAEFDISGNEFDKQVIIPK